MCILNISFDSENYLNQNLNQSFFQGILNYSYYYPKQRKKVWYIGKYLIGGGSPSLCKCCDLSLSLCISLSLSLLSPSPGLSPQASPTTVRASLSQWAAEMLPLSEVRPRTAYCTMSWNCFLLWSNCLVASEQKAKLQFLLFDHRFKTKV